jgi:glycosyltransferase involved in cell wall biosynthesis
VAYRKISVVIPALNEEGIVGKTVKQVPTEKLKALGLETEILVIDNASDDGTAKEAEEAGARVVREEKRGYGNAYGRGLREATGDIIVLGDADGTYPLEKAPEFIKPILEGSADFVNGSRMKGRIMPGAMPWLHRYVGNPLLTFVLNTLFHLHVSDAHCGMKAFSREAKEKMNLKSPGMEFASEVIIEAARKKLRIAEVPIEYRARGGGKAKLKSFQDGWRHLRFMLLYSPTALFVAPGLLLLSTGLLLVAALIGGPLHIGGVGIDVHTMVLGNMLVIVGFQTLALGMYAKAYAAINYGVEPGTVTKTLLSYESLDWGIIAGAIVFSAGLLLGFGVVAQWVQGGFGELSEVRAAIMASTLAVLGIQTVFSSLFFSMLLINRGR